MDINLNIFKQPDPSGRFSKESFLSKNYPNEYNFIINYCIIHNLIEVTFKEKVWLCLNNRTNYPLCRKSDCNNRVSFRNSSLGYREYCSIKCISSDPNIIKLKEEKSIIKFGTKTPAESKEIKSKIIKTNQIKYGGNSAMCNKEIQNKSKETLLKNYGVENPSWSTTLLNKRIESFKENIDSYKESYKKTSMERYGVDHPWKNKKIHDKSIDFFYKSYKDRIQSKLDKMCIYDYRFIKFEHNPTYLVFNCNKCSSEFKILPYQFYYRATNKLSICTNCYPISSSKSLSQNSLFDFVSGYYKNEIIQNYKIDGYEIDIYLPNLKIGFEFNGVWWHSSNFKDNNYHLKKHNLFIKHGLCVVSIWEDDWVCKQDIVKSMILNKIGLTNRKIYARKLKIKEISYGESREFLIDNHLQGDCKSKIRIALIQDNEILSMMTFSKLRLALNSKGDGNICELNRFCNKINTSVVGGASKLLKYFIDKYNPLKIETYSDNMISSGKLYENLGFKYEHTSKPGYWYLVNKIREHRFNWRKSVLVKMGYDKSKTEEEIMIELGYPRVYNAGNKKWIYKK